MRRSLADARAVFETEVEPRVNDYHRQVWEARLKEAEARAKNQADEFIGFHEEQVLELRDEALRELAEVRDGYDSLSRDQRVGAADYARSLSDLRHRQADAEAMLEKADKLVDTIEATEADPVAFHDQLSQIANRIMEDWPW